VCILLVYNVSLVVSAIDCVERLVSKMTCDVLGLTMKSTRFAMSLIGLMSVKLDRVGFLLHGADARHRCQLKIVELN